MTYTPIWDKRLANTADPALLELAPPGTFIYRVVDPGFDGNSNFQALYTHVTGNGFDFSQWAADNDGISIDDPFGLTIYDIRDGNVASKGLSRDPGQLVRITNFNGYFILEATDGVPDDSSNNFDNTIASTITLRAGIMPTASGGTEWDNTNLPDLPIVFDPEVLALSEQLLINTATFDTILNGTGSAETPGRPDDGLLYPRGFQTL